MYKSLLTTALFMLLCAPLGAQGGDECATAEVIPVTGYGSYVVAMDNTTATTGIDPAPTIPCAVVGALNDDIWFSFTPDADGALMVDTCDPTGWDTDMVVYDGSLGCADRLAGASRAWVDGRSFPVSLPGMQRSRPTRH